MPDESETISISGDIRYVRMSGEPIYDIEAGCYLTDPFTYQPQGKLKQIFTDIYERNTWGSRETRSGPGSERARTLDVQRGLRRLIKILRVQSVLDIPCGDFNWMSEANLSGVDYIGADIVDELIQEAAECHGGPSRSFIVRDFTQDALPKADLIVCRDGLVHLSNVHALTAIRNFQRCSSKYLLATSFVNTKINKDITTGGWRPINLCLPPFSFREPIDMIPDGMSEDYYSDKVLALWRISDLC